MPVLGSAAAVTTLSFGGRLARNGPAWKVAYSASAPEVTAGMPTPAANDGGAPNPNTSCLTSNPRVPGPILVTVPATSVPGTNGKSSGTISRTVPAVISRSAGLSEAAATRTCSCPGPGSGIGRSSTVNVPGVPYPGTTRAFMSTPSKETGCLSAGILSGPVHLGQSHYRRSVSIWTGGSKCLGKTPRGSRRPHGGDPASPPW
jgi:hypothetical protein